MIITPSSIETSTLLEGGAPRSSGLHLSAIYSDMTKHLYSGKPINPLYMALGRAWEDYFDKWLTTNVPGATRPGEFYSVEHQVYYTPDVIIQEGDGFRVADIKLSFKSFKGFPEDEKFISMMRQLKWYAYLLGTNLGRLYALFVCGNYKNPTEANPDDTRQPTMKVLDFEWTEQELAENWAELMNHRASMEAA